MNFRWRIAASLLVAFGLLMSAGCGGVSADLPMEETGAEMAAAAEAELEEMAEPGLEGSADGEEKPVDSKPPADDKTPADDKE